MTDTIDALRVGPPTTVHEPTPHNAIDSSIGKRVDKLIRTVAGPVCIYGASRQSRLQEALSVSACREFR